MGQILQDQTYEVEERALAQIPNEWKCNWIANHPKGIFF